MVLSDEPLIPKKLHYMWLGKKPLPNNLKNVLKVGRSIVQIMKLSSGMKIIMILPNILI